jgi:hypothetical protein
MPIILTNPFVPPAPNYDKVHLDHLTIVQEKTTASKATVQARVRLYHQDANGEKHFAPETRDIAIDDAESFALTLLYAQGDTRGAQAMEHVKALVALLVETGTDLGQTVVS